MDVLEIVALTLHMCENSDSNLHKCQQRPVGSNIFREGLLPFNVKLTFLPRSKLWHPLKVLKF
jgi:hypothetical protein